MVSSGYIFDSNVIISIGQRSYPLDLFPSFWKHLATLIENKTINISDGVIREIRDKLNHEEDDKNKWRSWWVDRNPTCRNENHQETYSELVNLCNSDSSYKGDCNQNRIKRFFSKADPWIISLAKDINLTVVSDERPGSLKIPTICQLQQVRCISFIEFLREMNFIFESSIQA